MMMEQRASLEEYLSEACKGGFNFDNCARNETLMKMGMTPPKATKTGTTIVGSVFKDGLVIGADSRATAGEIIADKNCVKVHKLTDYMYACGAGTAADLDKMTDMLASNMKLMELNTGRRARVIAALRIAKQHLFRYMGYVGAYLIIGGIDYYGPHLYTVAAHGSTSMDQYVADGSGSLAALGILERQFKPDMTQEEAIKLVRSALMAGMHADLSSGNSLRFCVLTKEGATQFKQEVPDFCEAPKKEDNYKIPAGTTKTMKVKRVIPYKVVDEQTLAAAARGEEPEKMIS